MSEEKEQTVEVSPEKTKKDPVPELKKEIASLKKELTTLKALYEQQAEEAGKLAAENERLTIKMHVNVPADKTGDFISLCGKNYDIIRALPAHEALDEIRKRNIDHETILVEVGPKK